MNTIIHAGGVIEPLAIIDYSSRREAGNIVHQILGRSEPDITIRPAGLRTGTLNLVFADEAESRAAEDAHAAGAVFSILSDTRATVEMAYVVAGDIGRSLSVAGSWTVTVGFQEVVAP